MLVPTLDMVRAEKARRRHLDFMRFTWRKQDPFLVGLHTRAICARLDRAMDDYAKGQSTYLMIKVPFRHGKSDIISRYFPINFIGKFPDDEVILATHSSSLAYSFSKFSRLTIDSEKYQAVYPGIRLARGDRSVSEWGVEDHLGKIYFSGLRSGIAGKGGNLIVLDDFHRNREDAESEKIRDKNWDGFTDDVMTRQAPVCIVIVLGTPWHQDDVFGRIRQHMEMDDAFPMFEEMKFPALDEDGTLGYEEGVLFPERFSQRWYSAQAATLGTYGTSSLFQCDPSPRHGNILNTDKLEDGTNILEDFPSGLNYCWGFDLASSEKERKKDDPDYTVGVRIGVRWLKTAIKDLFIPQIYVDDMLRGQWEAPKRKDMILAKLVPDKNSSVGIEAFGAYKDAYTELKEIIGAIISLSKVMLPGDKVAKQSPLEPVFEAGNIFLRKGPWNAAFIKECKQFPGGKHDDIPDALRVAYEIAKRTIRTGRINVY